MAKSKVSKDVAVMRIVVSLLLLVSGLFILTSPNFLIETTASTDLQKAATGWIGLVAGYWLS